MGVVFHGLMVFTTCAANRKRCECYGGKELIEKGARTLCKLAERIDTVRMKEPSFKMVLTATGEYAYRRPDDGVIVCPLSALRP